MIVSAGPAPTGAWKDWLKRFVSLTKGLTYDCGLHLYSTSVDGVVSDYQATKTICGGRDVRVTEIGVSRVWVGAEGQAQLLPAEIKALLDRGVTYVVIHEMFETPYLEGFSMLDPSDQPYPVYYAIQAMVNG